MRTFWVYYKKIAKRRIDIANFFAEQSMEKRHPGDGLVRLRRAACRRVYWRIMEWGARSYPYANTSFAHWDDFYEAIVDSQKFVVRMSPSYIAWLIKRYCHRKLKLPKPGEREPDENPFDAKRWPEILKHNDWKEGIPTKSLLASGIHFVGVIPDEGTFGQLVWLVGIRQPEASGECGWEVITYREYEKAKYLIPLSDGPRITWYREPEPSRCVRILAHIMQRLGSAA